MRDLLVRYDCTIYDTNCIVYHCFRTDEKSVTGETVVIDSPRFSDLARALTQYLRDHDRKIHTLKQAFDEATQELLARVVKARITDPGLRAALGVPTGRPFPPTLELKITKNIRKKVRGLQGEAWFVIKHGFSPPGGLAREVKDFLLRAAQGVPGTKPGGPSDVDVLLLLYSADSRAPVVSNDAHLTQFARELECRGYAHKVVPLTATAG